MVKLLGHRLVRKGLGTGVVVVSCAERIDRESGLVSGGGCEH